MNLAGFDLSLTSSGVSIAGITRTVSSKHKGVERLSDLRQQFTQICQESQVECAVIEGYSFASRNSQAHSIGELGGVVRLVLFDLGIPFVEVPPTSRAKFATGRGNASKGEVISAISAKTGLVFAGAGGNDECDAWVLEQMALTKMGCSQYSWTKEQLASLDKVDWSALERAM
jgi:crossover junction endodeoxyribonuclease RuvC